jgi:hypothetical protein
MTDFEQIELALSLRERDLQRREAELKSEWELLARQREALSLLLPLKDTPKTEVASDKSNGDKSDPPTETPFSIRAAILNALDSLPAHANFSSRDVYEQLNKMSLSFDLEKNRSNISTYLRQFSEQGVIDVTEGGKGQTPHLYRKK